jgi:hypothetical protein
MTFLIAIAIVVICVAAPGAIALLLNLYVDVLIRIEDWIHARRHRR